MHILQFKWEDYQQQFPSMKSQLSITCNGKALRLGAVAHTLVVLAPWEDKEECLNPWLHDKPGQPRPHLKTNQQTDCHHCGSCTSVSEMLKYKSKWADRCLGINKSVTVIYCTQETDTGKTNSLLFIKICWKVMHILLYLSVFNITIATEFSPCRLSFLGGPLQTHGLS